MMEIFFAIVFCTLIAFGILSKKCRSYTKILVEKLWSLLTKKNVFGDDIIWNALRMSSAVYDDGKRQREILEKSSIKAVSSCEGNVQGFPFSLLTAIVH